MRKYSNIGTDREALFLVRFGFFLVSGQNRHHLKKKERKKQQERERTREREKERERTKRTRASFNQKHNHNSTTFCREKKHRKLCLSTHHGEPRSGGNLERVTREKRERGAFLIVCSCVFSLFFLSKRSARKVRERFYSFPK